MLHSDRSLAHIVAVAAFAMLMVSPNKFARAAARDAEAPSVTLRYSSANLDTAQGVGILYRRIHSAASSVCGVYDRALSEEKAQWDKCVNEAVATAVASVHSERLSAYYWRRIRGWKRSWIDAPTSLAVR